MATSMEQTLPSQDLNSDLFPGCQDLQEHLRPSITTAEKDFCTLKSVAQSMCSGPENSDAVKPPPGLDLPQSHSATAVHGEPEALMPAYVTLTSANANSAEGGSNHQGAVQPDVAQAAAAQAVKAILHTVEQMSQAGNASAYDNSLLAELAEKAIGSLQAVQGQLKRSKLPSSPKRAQLRSSAKPFESLFEGTGFFNSPSMEAWEYVPQARGPVLKLESSLPMQLPELPSLSTHLQELQTKDPQRVLLVGKIRSLGFDAPTKLKDYFEWFGPVENVLCPPSHNSGRSGARLKPAEVGYVVMKSVQGAAEALASTESHVIEGEKVKVRQYVPAQCP